MPSPMAFARSTIACAGSCPSGALIRMCMPAVAPASSQELPMLQAPSPTNATVSPARSPLCSAIVSRSASSWQGWKSSVSALTTGTPAKAAITSIEDWA